MELRHLRYFVAVAEERSFSRAANRLWVAQPALSTQIQRLEAEVGVRLFARSTRGAELTEAGRGVLEWARAVLRAADHAVAMGHEQAGGLVGGLRVGVATYAHTSATRRVLDAFGRERPAVDLAVFEASSQLLWERLSAAQLDAIIAPAFFAGAGVGTASLGSEPWVAVMADKHPLAQELTLDVSELAGQRVLVSSEALSDSYDRAVSELLSDVDRPPKPRSTERPVGSVRS